jgi:hypothetical protein
MASFGLFMLYFFAGWGVADIMLKVARGCRR